MKRDLLDRLGVIDHRALPNTHYSLDYHQLMPDLTPEDRARRIKVLLYDVDGVLTNGDITIIPPLDGDA